MYDGTHVCDCLQRYKNRRTFPPLPLSLFASPKGFLTIFIRKKRHRSGNIGVIVVEKIGGNIGVLFYDLSNILSLRKYD